MNMWLKTAGSLARVVAVSPLLSTHQVPSGVPTQLAPHGRAGGI